MSSNVSFSQIKKNVGLSIIAQIISLAVSFVMNLILPKFISEYQYALWQTYLLYVGYVGILHFGLLDGIVLRYSQYDYCELDKPRIRSQFKCLLAMTNVFCLISVVCAVLFCNTEMRMVFIMTAIGIITRTMFTYTSYSFQITNRIKKYAEMIIGYRIFYGFGAIVMLFFGLHNFYYFCLVDLCSDIFGVLFSAHNNKGMYFGPSLNIRDTIVEAKKNISAGIMLMISNWSSFLLTGSARLIIQWHWDKITFGKVSFAFSITNLFLTFVTAISVVLFPSLKRTDKQNLPGLYQKIRGAITPFLIIILIFYYPGCWVLRKWLPTYNNSLVYLGILLPIIIFSSKISLLTNNYLKALRKEKMMLIINLISVVIAISMFTICAYFINNLRMLLVSIVISILICSTLSEFVVMKTLNIFDISYFFGEILMALVFEITTILSSQMIGLIVYTMAVVLFLYFNRNNMSYIYKKSVAK